MTDNSQLENIDPTGHTFSKNFKDVVERFKTLNNKHRYAQEAFDIQATAFLYLLNNPDIDSCAAYEIDEILNWFRGFVYGIGLSCSLYSGLKKMSAEEKEAKYEKIYTSWSQKN
jgi:hypothetical protein